AGGGARRNPGRRLRRARRRRGSHPPGGRRARRRRARLHHRVVRPALLRAPRPLRARRAGAHGLRRMKTWPLTALVLTAGLGTRLRPLTDVRAKPALPVGEEALVCRVLRQLAAQGVRHAVLNLYHLPATIAAEVGDGRQLGLSVRYAWEHPGPLGSAGSIRHMLPLVSDERLLVVNGDTLCDLPVQALAEAHAASGALVTMGLMPHPAPEKYNGVVLDEGGAVTGFSTPGAWTTTWHYPGVQVTERRVFETLPDNEPAEY